jgi:hypothetical protein
MLGILVTISAMESNAAFDCSKVAFNDNVTLCLLEGFTTASGLGSLQWNV